MTMENEGKYDMTQLLSEITSKIENLEIEKVRITHEIGNVDSWLAANKQSYERPDYVKERNILTHDVRCINVKLNKLRYDRSLIETKLRQKDRLDAILVIKDQKQLLFKCFTVFSSFEKNGIGFDIRAKKVYEELKKVIMQ